VSYSLSVSSPIYIILKRYYILPLRKEDILTSVEVANIFANIDEIAALHFKIYSGEELRVVM
jgi:hypothetical protein